MNVLKCLVDWEMSRRESETNKNSRSLAEEVNANESADDMPDNFEKAKAHKSTMEAAISEVIDWALCYNLKCLAIMLIHLDLILEGSCCSQGFTVSIALQFNRKPVKGVEYLISNKLVENNPTSVAQFLRNTASLNKVEYLIYP